MARLCNNFIDEFAVYMKGMGSPPLFVKWSAIFAVSAALERKVWIHTLKKELYANQFIILVGTAGIGKSVCTRTVYELLEAVKKGGNTLHIAPTSVTKASLIDALDNAERNIIRPMAVKAITSFNSLIIIPNEFGVFLPTWEGDFMSTLTDLWDCGRYAETRRTKSINIEIPNTQLNLFSATTPAHLTNLLPEGAWEQGFMSRVLMVFSGEVIHGPIFGDVHHDEEVWKKLVHDIKDIYNLFGQISIADEALEAMNAWAMAGAGPMPDHPKLVGYCARRVAHVLKLCMVACVASSDDMLITLDHFAEALDWIVELELYMPDIFKSMKVGGDARAMDECWHYAYQYWMKKQEPVPEHLIYGFLQERAPAHSIQRIVEVMVRAQLFKEQLTPSCGKGYVPKARV